MIFITHDGHYQLMIFAARTDVADVRAWLWVLVVQVWNCNRVSVPCPHLYSMPSMSAAVQMKMRSRCKGVR